MNAIIAALLLAPGTPLPEIDRSAIDLQARAEALQPRRAATARTGLFELEAMTTVCRAAAGQRDPAAFLETLGRAYGLNAADQRVLRGSCAAYLAGRAEGRR